MTEIPHHHNGAHSPGQVEFQVSPLDWKLQPPKIQNHLHQTKTDIEKYNKHDTNMEQKPHEHQTKIT